MPSDRDRGDGRDARDAGSRTRSSSAPSWATQVNGSTDRVASGREPAAAGHLAGQPACAEGDRRPADDRTPDAGDTGAAVVVEPPRIDAKTASVDRSLAAMSWTGCGAGRVCGVRPRRGGGLAARQRHRRRYRCWRRSSTSSSAPPPSRPTTRTSCGSAVGTNAALSWLRPGRPRRSASGGAGSGPVRGASPGRPARASATRAPRPCLVLRSVLARVRVFLGVERPVRARRRAVPGGAAPVGLEGLGIGPVVGGRPERRLVRRRSFAGGRPVRRHSRAADCRLSRRQRLSMPRRRRPSAASNQRDAMAGVDRSRGPGRGRGRPPYAR